MLTEAIGYLDYHPEYSYPRGKAPFTEAPDASGDEEDEETRQGFRELLRPLLLNSALARMKLAGPANLRNAISLTNRALEIVTSDADRGRCSRSISRYGDIG